MIDQRDLCWKIKRGNGSIYVDIVRSDIDQTWSVYVDGKRIRYCILTRKEAALIGREAARDETPQ